MNRIIDFFKSIKLEYKIAAVIVIVLLILGSITAKIFPAQTILTFGLISLGIWTFSSIVNLLAYFVFKKQSLVNSCLSFIGIFTGYISVIASVALSFVSFPVAICTLALLVLFFYDAGKNYHENTKQETELAFQAATGKDLGMATFILLITTVTRALPLIVFLILI
jgi:hypothetical protein